MMRARIVGLACALGLTAGAAHAQTFYLGNTPNDSMVGVLSTSPTQVDVRWNYGSGYYYSLQLARLTVHYDPAAVHLLGVSPAPGDSIAAVDSSVPGRFTFTTGGCVGGTDVSVARIRMQLDPSASSGTNVWLTADTAATYVYCGATPGPAWFATVPTGLCTATAIYGDVDGTLGIDSRDALITLSAAVGLPVTGFNLANGDVDADGLVNSRDALYMLTYSIGLPTNQPTRIGTGVPIACPAPAPAGEIAVMRLRQGYSGYDSIGVLAATATVPVTVPNGPYQPRGPRLAADGVSIVTACSAYYVEICRIQTDGTGYRSLTGTDYYDWSPDWNPAGDSIAFVHLAYNGAYPAVMDTVPLAMRNLSGQSITTGQVTGTVAWDRTGSSIAYVKADATIWVVNRDSSGDHQVTGATDVATIAWSPAGDSIAFTRNNEPGIWVVPAAGGAAVQRVSFRTNGPVSGAQTGFDWGPQGILFASEEPGRMGLWLLAPTGALWRVTSGPHVEPAFRRNP